ncbi:MAG: hypothetical protein KC636_04635, partial [Myxococcales bacterium]|nr:hypothetical protein [Myxococcales bacterium]
MAQRDGKTDPQGDELALPTFSRKGPLLSSSQREISDKARLYADSGAINSALAAASMAANPGDPGHCSHGSHGS